jgi:hypothetical protein
MSMTMIIMEVMLSIANCHSSVLSRVRVHTPVSNWSESL